MATLRETASSYADEIREGDRLGRGMENRARLERLSVLAEL